MTDLDTFINQGLMYFNRRPPSEIAFLDFISVALTRYYGFTRVAFYKVDSSRKHLVPIYIVGPDKKEEHKSVEEKVAKLTDAQIFEEDRLGSVEARTSPSLDSRFKNFWVPLGADSILRNCYVSGDSYLGGKVEHKRTSIDEKTQNEVFGTEEFGLITVKGRKEDATKDEEEYKRGEVIGIFYCDFRHSNRKFTENDGKPIFAKEDFRRVVEETSLYLQGIKNEDLATLGAVVDAFAHDMRNPVSIIGGFANRMLRLKEEPKRYFLKSIVNYVNSILKHNEVSKYARIISKEARQLEDLLVQLEDYTRQLKPELQMTDLHQVLLEALNSNGHDIFYSTTDLKGARYVLADPKHVRIALTNLADIVYHEMGGHKDNNKLAVNVCTDEDFAQIVLHLPHCVSHEEIQNVLFSLSAMNSDKSLAGLRLSMAEKYIKANSGSFALDFHPQAGITFTLKLPIYKS